MTATIFTPKDNSLASRVEAWKQVYQANKQLKVSLNTQDEDWQDRLGEQADREFAEQTISASFHQACASLSQNELKQAQQLGLLSNQDIQAIVISQRMNKSTSKSKQQLQHLSHFRSHSRKR